MADEELDATVLTGGGCGLQSWAATDLGVLCPDLALVVLGAVNRGRGPARHVHGCALGGTWTPGRRPRDGGNGMELVVA